jgi:TetR/AcrR family transcriptional regulator, regulator of cefoperazone and chloramphenicol sensitivity
MEVKNPRPYKSEQRARQAEATRRRILDVAGDLFARDGYAAVSMAQIARQAGVSVANLYLHFPGKAALIRAMTDAIAASPDLSVEQVERPMPPLEQMRLGARIMRNLNERSWVVADILRTARGTDDGLGEIWEQWQQRHDQALRRAILSLQANGGLREGLPVDDAVASLATLAGTDAYRTLVREHGWTADRYEAWLFRLGCTELLGIIPDPA